MSEYVAVFKVEAQAEPRKTPRPQAMTILRKLAEPEADPFAFGPPGSPASLDTGG
ncbi:hypothetical protein HDA36_004877 [Nocardiopsis composta]|uniref:Uncharacterized protein n=1 Tax=Nocardiopsis composta TaxID=157465 RepID=A0A7W8QS08_9ACTN|nr:hypothetical protein [Nocardiopsis composta]